MPGVNVTTAVRTGPVGTGDIVAGQVFMAGEAERGSITAPTLLRSFSDYTTYYGNYQTGNLYAHVKTYFDEGGTRCYVQRVLGSGSATGAITLNDSSASATMVVTAKNPGAWAANLDVQVAAADVSGFKIKIYLDDVLLTTTRDLTSVADAIDVLNTSPDVGHLIVVSDDSTSSANPATAAATALSGGSDGSAVSDANRVTGLSLFGENLKSGAVCIPGANGSTIWNGLRDHAEAYNRVALCGFASGDAASTAKTNASAYYTDAKASYMAFYWPHVKVDAPAASELATGTSSTGSATVTISPESYAAAARTRAVQVATGPWRAGAGLISAARTVTDLAQEVSPTAGDLLDDARVNALRKIGNSIRVYGARSISNDEANWRYITQRDTINYLVYGVQDRMEQYVFSTIDSRGNLFGRIRASIKGFLDPIRVAGGLYEAYDDDNRLIDPGYSVVVDSTINPASQLAGGLVKAQVGVRVSGVADLIQVTISKSNLTTPVI